MSFLVISAVAATAATAQEGTLFVENDRVGIGTPTPGQKLHVHGTNGLTQLTVEEASSTLASRVLLELVNNGKIRFALRNTANGIVWTFDNGGNFTISKVGTGINEFLLDGSGNLTITGTLFQNSDKETKREIEPVDAQSVLEKVVGLPLATWNRQTEDVSVRHLGPMAQDFYSAFGLGQNDRTVATLDLAGVSLAAIQGLHGKLTQREAELTDLKRANLELVERIARLEQMIERRTPSSEE